MQKSTTQNTKLNTSLNEEGKKSIKTDPENDRISTHERYYLFKKLEERLNTLRRNMGDVKKVSNQKF